MYIYIYEKPEAQLPRRLGGPDLRQRLSWPPTPPPPPPSTKGSGLRVRGLLGFRASGFGGFGVWGFYRVEGCRVRDWSQGLFVRGNF